MVPPQGCTFHRAMRHRRSQIHPRRVSHPGRFQVLMLRAAGSTTGESNCPVPRNAYKRGGAFFPIESAISEGRPFGNCLQVHVSHYSRIEPFPQEGGERYLSGQPRKSSRCLNTSLGTYSRPAARRSLSSPWSVGGLRASWCHVKQQRPGTRAAGGVLPSCPGREFCRVRSPSGCLGW